jgi:hypothetical protein
MLALIIPVSKSDAHLLPTFVQACQHLGHFGKHRVIFVPTLEMKDAPEVSLAAEHMKDVSDDVKIVPLKFTPEGGWPKACNQHFNATVHIGSSTGCNWYFCELDTTPMVADWLNILETDLNMSGKNYMGSVVPTRFEEGIKGDHMVGSAIYAHNMGQTASLWKFCHAQSKTPFDIYHRDELRPRWHASKFMQHMWSTVNYREVDGRTICDPHPDNPKGSDHSGEVRDNAVVVHGCKDGSLAQLILSKPPRVLEGAASGIKPVQKVFFSGNPEVWRLEKPKAEGQDETVVTQTPAPVAFQEEVTPEKHFERLCEALGLFHEEHLDIYQSLLDRIKAPTEDLAEEPVSEVVEEVKTAPEAPESQETPVEIPAPIVTPPPVVLEAPVEVAFPTLEDILASKGNGSLRFSLVMAQFQIPPAQSVKFKGHLNDLGFIINKLGWMTEPVSGQASFATA